MSGMAKIDLPYIQVFTDRHGHVRHYFRRAGYPRVPIPGTPGSAAFMTVYGELINAAPAQPTIRVQPRSINALIIEYYRSAEFRALADSTKRGYRNHLDRFRAKYGDRGSTSIQAHHLESIFHGMAATPGAAANLRKRLGRVFRLAVRLGWRSDNPIRETEAPRRKTRGFIPWTEDEIDRFRAHWPSGSRERLALEILLCTGQRRSDARRMGRQHMVGTTHIRIIQQKGGRELVIRIHPRLLAEIEQQPMAMTFVTTRNGAAFSEAGFSQWFVERAVMAGVMGRSPHGLRKAAGRRLAEAGCTAHEIMSILGHRTLAEAEKYTRDADQSRLADAAMDKLEARS